MTSAKKKAERNLSQSFGVDAFLYACPKCGAAIGERCTKRFGGKVIPTAQPHQERLDLDKRIRRTL